MKVAIIGAGNVGGALGAAWCRKGHQVVFGVRNPADAKIQKLISGIKGQATATSIAEAVAHCETVVLATHWEGLQGTLQSAGDFAGKVLIDATNPLVMSAEFLRRGLQIGHNTSAAEQIAQWAKGARVVKAFNTIGAQNMSNPTFGGERATMFICGDDDDAKQTVKQLSDDLGFETVDAGPLTIARLLEPVAMLWMQLCYGMNIGPDFCFKMLKR